MGARGRGRVYVEGSCRVREKGAFEVSWLLGGSSMTQRLNTSYLHMQLDQRVSGSLMALHMLPSGLASVSRTVALKVG